MANPSLNILEIKSDKSELNKVKSFLKELFEAHKLPETEFNRVYLCISEAVVNCIVHGNKNDSNKKVKISTNCKSNKLKVHISDEGEGFSIEKVEDPTLETNIKKESGRGIHIIKSLVDSIKYNNKGNSIQFKIYCK